jgi:hypothetical protein
MIDYYDEDLGTMTMTCDECGDEDVFDGSWQDCIEEAKAQGWKITSYTRYGKRSKEWIHACPDCTEMKLA